MWIEAQDGHLVNLNWYSSISVGTSIVDNKFEVKAFVANTGEESWWTSLSGKYKTEEEAKQELEKIKDKLLPRWNMI